MTCPCGEPATTKVRVSPIQQVDRGHRFFFYCADCAHDIVATLEGTEIVP